MVMKPLGFVFLLVAGLASGFVSVSTSHGWARSSRLSSEKKGFGTPPPPPKKTAAEKKIAAENAKSPLLQQLLDEERAKQEALQKSVEDLRERDAYVRSQPDAGRLPDSVANRMAVRMALFGGLPTFGGIGLFVWFYFSATQNDNVFQPAAVAAATTAPWVVGLLGIGYGAFSASWDEDVEGSVLGFKEFKLNIQRILEGLRRSANDAKLREIDNNKK